ncbi:hypothetical protein RJ639_002198 [Escallonia herrerae]|uniref:NAB domain-containing protein n=1 Tax=Escallonia herrerae TaxID=1293975 RepID=A0AA88X8C4_9ASTE|nr:hypothetical protein RJ639_002198 [Escallonia herrerae]
MNHVGTEAGAEVEAGPPPPLGPSHLGFFSPFLVHLDERLKAMACNNAEEDKADDTFAERAEAYYRQRPQLLSLLHDLYNAYLALADRYCRSLAKQQRLHRRSQRSSPVSAIRLDYSHDDNGDGGDIDSDDAESSLSYQATSPAAAVDADTIVAELVMKTVEFEILADEEERWKEESSRKIELQRSLLEVLESERLILLNENGRLGYRVSALVEENKGLASESLFMRRKAGELARCLLQVREDHRVCMLSSKIEDLQGQIHRLEKRNKEYYEQLVKQQGEGKRLLKEEGKEVTLEDCFQVKGKEDEAASVTSTISSSVANLIIKGRGHARGGGKKASKLWDRVKKFDMFMCGPHVNSTGC